MAWKEAASTFETEIKSENLRYGAHAGYMLRHRRPWHFEQSK